MFTLSRQCLFHCAQTRLFWLGIAGLCFALFAGALFYQHVLNHLPCEICIYVRVWVLGLMLVALAGLAARHSRLGRVIFCLAGLALTLGLANETWNLVVVEYNLGGGSGCAFKANFPAWAPLDTWAPFAFEVQDFCRATPILFAGITMTHALILTSAALLGAFLLGLAGAVSRR